MIEQGWRTILVHSKTTLSYSEGSLLMQQERHEYSVPLAQIRTIIIDNPSIVLNAALMNRFIAQGIKVILCNEKHFFQSEINASQYRRQYHEAVKMEAKG